MKQAVHHRLAATALAAGLILTACGQKPGVHVEGGGQIMAGSQQTGGATTGGTGGSTSGSTGTAGSGSTGSGASAGSTGGSTGGTGGTTGDSGGGGDAGAGGDTGGDRSQAGADAAAPEGGEQAPADAEGEQQQGQPEGEQQPAQGQRQVTGQDRTGVTDESITVAFHAPVTGAAPLPAESFREARDLYWKAAADEGRTFLGREKVEVLFQDDKYDPQNATQVCRQLASTSFIVAGGGGTDQIQACGRLAGVDQFPYFSAGVTEAGLEGNPWYFASSMTYRQQGALLAQYIAKEFPGQKVGAIVTDTANFNDAVQGFEAGIEQAGISGDYAGVLRHSKNDSTWYNQLGNEMANRDVEILYILTSPVDYIQFAQQNKDRGFQYVGVGVSMGLNAVLGSGCDEVDDGIFFSPFPGLDWARENVPEFFAASKKFGTVPDDLALALWGTNKQLDLLFQRYEEMFGTDLTREDFRALVEGSGQLESGIFPAVEYSPENHFGGKSAHVLQANCDTQEYETLATFATGF